MFLDCSPVVLVVPVKTCNKCGEVKPSTPEYFRQYKSGSLRPRCIECEQAALKEWRQVNQEHVRQSSKAYREANKERKSVQNKAWREKNAERLKTSAKERYDADPEKYRALSREWHSSNRDRGIERARNWRKGNQDHVTAYAATYREENRDRISTSHKTWYAANAEHARQTGKAWYQANKERKLETDKAWRKANPGYDKKWKRAHREQVRVSNRARYAANREYFIEYRKINRDKAVANHQRYRARKRELPDTFVTSDWHAALDYFGGCCAACGRQPGLWHTLAMDHWIPLTSLDCPGTVAWNIVPLCHGNDGCNNSKNARDPADWLIDKFGKRKGRAILRKIEAFLESRKPDTEATA